MYIIYYYFVTGVLKNHTKQHNSLLIIIYIFTLDNYDKYFIKKNEIINDIHFNDKMFKESLGYDEKKVIEEEYKLILNDTDNNYIIV